MLALALFISEYFLETAFFFLIKKVNQQQGAVDWRRWERAGMITKGKINNLDWISIKGYFSGQHIL